MKKIIAAFDGLKFSEGTKEYAIQLARQAGAHLVGVFLEDFTYTSYKVYELVTADGGLIGAAKKRFDKKDSKQRSASVIHFEKACESAGIEYSIHRDRNIAIKELLHEAVYADLLVIDSKETLRHHPEKMPTSFIRDLLAHVHCPVLLIPHVYKPAKKIVLLYDGEPSSVHAIKMFSYTMKPSGQNAVEVLTVNSPKNSWHVPDSRLMKDFVKRHFPNSTYTVLKGLPELEIVKYLKAMNEIPLVVLGAYRRGMISRWFRASMADALMSQLKIPLFVAHNY